MSPARPALWVDTAVLAGRVARTSLRDPVTLVIAVFFPLVLMLLMSAGFAEIVMPGRGIPDYLDHSLPLFAVMGVAFASLTTGASTYLDLTSGFDRRLLAMPVARTAPFTARILGDIVRTLLTVVAVVAVGLGLGFQFRTDLPGVLGFLVLPVLLGIGLGWAMVALAAWARSAEAVGSILNAVLLVLSFLSTGFVPLQGLPGWAQPIAMVNPLSLAVEAMRALAQNTPATAPVLGTLVWAAGLTAVCAPLAAHGRHRRTR